MSTSPKSSLVERLVQDRLRAGDLESSAAQLLRLGEGSEQSDPAMRSGFDSAQSREPVWNGNLAVPPPPPQSSGAMQVRPLPEPAAAGSSPGAPAQSFHTEMAATPSSAARPPQPFRHGRLAGRHRPMPLESRPAISAKAATTDGQRPLKPQANNRCISTPPKTSNQPTLKVGRRPLPQAKWKSRPLNRHRSSPPPQLYSVRPPLVVSPQSSPPPAKAAARPAPNNIRTANS